MYLAFDTETTGINANKNNLLTACFIVTDDNLVEIDRLNLSLKHYDYNVSIKAMEINKIDLIKHHYESVDIKSARNLLLDFLKKHKNKLTNLDKLSMYNKTFTPIGHNVTFDINFIKNSGLLTENEYMSFISFNTLDTVCIAQYLKLTGDLPKKQSISLINLCKYYGIESPVSTESYHTAEYDIEMTLQLLRKFKSINEKLINSEKTFSKKRKTDEMN
jgi:DNA polymerase III alpha subunit (gram-positive type)